MRDIALTLVVFGALPLAVARPHVGILLWAWLGFMNPHRMTWGFAYSLPFAQAVAIATIVGMLFSRERYRVPVTRETIILALFVLWMFVTTLFALYPPGAWYQWDKVWKIQFMILLTLMAMRRPERVDALVWVIAGSLAFFGVKGGIFTILRGGNYLVWGPPGSFIGGNNEIALALVMTLPLMRYLQLTAERRVVRLGLTGAMLLTAIAAVGTHSRGGLLAGSATILFLVWKSRRRFAMLGVAAAIVFLSAVLMPGKWFERMESIRNWREDTSAMGRINAWGFAYNLALHRPLVGGGFETFRERFFRRFAPDPRDYHDAHSIYFEVLGEHGFVGLGLFLTLGLSTWRSCTRVRKRARRTRELRRFEDLARMVQVSLLAYAVGGAFLGLAYFDLYYNLVALVVLAKVLVDEALRAERREALAPAEAEPAELAPALAGRSS